MTVRRPTPRSPRLYETGEMKPLDLSGHNMAVYRGRLLSWWFQRRTELQPSEASILCRLTPALSNAEVLDIGVGGGRTTAHLVKLGVSYTGIDYSARMIARCKARYPALAFEVCDARNLSRFAAGRFDFVLFSFNGIDCVSHAERLAVLEEIRRVLSNSGIFVFSSHNRDFGGMKPPWALSHLPFGINPFANSLKFFGRIACYPIGIGNYLLNRKHQQQNDEYAILNDAANNYQMLTYCISVKKQLAQLRSAGYGAVEVVGVDGRWLMASEYGRCTEDPYLYYVCRR
jgi:SAM-dependent methyltransferase